MTLGDQMPSWCGPVTGEDLASGADVALKDLSRQSRWGLKGPAANDWLQANGFSCSEGNNQATLVGGVLVVRLSPGEFVLLATETGGAEQLGDLQDRYAADSPERCYDIPRQNMSAWFRLTGVGAPRLMAELCAVDLRPNCFAQGQVAQTSVASQNAIVIRNDHENDVGFDLLTDFASGHYFWNTLARKVGSNKEGIA